MFCSYLPFRVRLHVTETKSHPGMKKFQFTREFHPRMKRVECHLGMKFNLKENPHWVWKHIIKFIIDMLKHQTITFLEKLLCSSFSFAYFLIKAFQKQSPGGVFIKGVHRNFAKFTGKRLCQSPFLTKLE